jgi:formamidopyrimidine-DNA glycosylase
MPELPEVETIVQGLQEPLVGQTIIGFNNDWPNQVGQPDTEELTARIIGRRILAVGRRGKYLHLQLDGGEHLIIHLKMSGQLSVVDSQTSADQYVHTTFLLAGGKELRFRDVRKFGRVYLVDDPSVILGKLGPEPLSSEFSKGWLCKALKGRKRVIKPLLQDQSFIAGIGNIYADEALHRAAIRPDRISSSLSDVECSALHAAIQKTLATAILHEGSSIDRAYIKPDGSSGSMQAELQVYGRAGEPCYRCGAIVEKITLASRGTHYCPGCQH